MKNLGFLGLPNYAVTSDGVVYNLKFFRTMSLIEDSMGYIVTRFPNKIHKVHRLVLMAYKPVEGMEDLCVNHKDGNKKNNRLSNLEWVTRQENIHHAATELKNGWSSISEDTARQICTMMQDGMRNIDITNALDVNKNVVGAIRSGSSWYRVSRDYNIPKGSKKGKYSVEKVQDICRRLQNTDDSYYRIREDTGVNVSTLGSIEKRKTYTEISKNYSWPHRENAEIKYRGY